MSYRNGLPVADHLLLYHAYNPSASHPLSTSPYTGEARRGGLAFVYHLPLHRGGKGWWALARSAPLCREARDGGRLPALSPITGRQAPQRTKARAIGSYNLEIFLPHKKILDIFPSPPYTVKALMRWTISSLG